MSERATSRPWSEQEDHLLRQAVAQYGENDNWKNIALSVPGRTNKACRKRWLHSLQPNVKKSAWTPSEDQLLLDLFEKHGPKWSMIARQIAGRTDDACSKRYREALDPTLRKDQWTPEEDEMLMEAYARIGGKWGQVGQELQRSGLGCRNRWRLLERKRASRANQSPNQSPTSVIPVHEYPPPAPPVESTSPLLEISHEIPPMPSSADTQPDVHWPPYYPPEAYPLLNPADQSPQYQRTFLAPTPPPLEIPNPQGAPFQFSSSSLSAALSDPPRPTVPLPPLTAFNTPELISHDTLQDVEEQSTLSPLTHSNGMPEMHDVLMTLEDHSHQIPMEQQFQQPHLQIAISQPPYESHGFYMPYMDNCSYISPISFPTEIPQQDHLFPEMWKLRGPDDVECFDSPLSIFDALGNFDNHDGLSSASSTPFATSNPLSPTSSPNPLLFVELPNTELPSTGSLLFSPADGSQQGSVRRPAKKSSTSRKQKPSSKLSLPARLSSSLPLSNDPHIKPYACGRPACWPADQLTSSCCFATSGELQDHSKDMHPEEEFADKPFRCALAGCGKSWKSLNGLQYHLQISTVHFTNALHDKFSKQPGTPVQQMSMLSTEGDSEDSDRRYPCPTPGCYKAYRQPSGLRYHVKHGHPPDLPTQLNFVPPALERQLPAKAKKMRPKPLPDNLMFEQAMATTAS